MSVPSTSPPGNDDEETGEIEPGADAHEDETPTPEGGETGVQNTDSDETGPVTAEDVETGKVGVQVADLSGDDTDDEEEAESEIDDFNPNDFFDSVDTGSPDSGSDEEEEPEIGINSANSDVVEEKILEVASKLAVVGLEDGQEKNDLQQDFHELAELLQVDVTVRRFAEEYIVPPEEVGEMDPATAMCASLAMYLAIVLVQRPDGTEIVTGTGSKMKNVVKKAQEARN